jgi:hypothetical protein
VLEAELASLFSEAVAGIGSPRRRRRSLKAGVASSARRSALALPSSLKRGWAGVSSAGEQQRGSDEAIEQGDAADEAERIGASQLIPGVGPTWKHAKDDDGGEA